MYSFSKIKFTLYTKHIVIKYKDKLHVYTNPEKNKLEKKLYLDLVKSPLQTYRGPFPRVKVKLFMYHKNNDANGK